MSKLSMSAGTVFIGRTADRERVWAEIRLEAPAGRPVEFTDHTTGPQPVVLSICWTIASPGKSEDMTEIQEHRFLSFGQTPAHERRITKRAPSMSAAELHTIESAWELWHLNDMNAGCDHMAGVTVPEGVNAQTWKLDNLVCPVTGYRYGRAWLARTVPSETVAALVAIIEGETE